MAKQDLSVIREIEDALQDIVYGSVEIYVQDNKITQIAVRKTVKTSVQLHKPLKQVADNADNTVGHNNKIPTELKSRNTK